MAFLKFSRDKRGYENFYLLQPSARGKSRPRLLYWFHTPPDVKVGRTPFDPAVRRALEAQNPDVAFDWTAIVDTPIPPVDTERWRERRRVERAMRAASEVESPGDGAEASREPAEPERPVERATPPPVGQILTLGPDVPQSEIVSKATEGPAVASNLSSPAPDVAGSAQPRRRRRRRGRRKTQAGQEATLASDLPADDAAPPDEELEP